VRQIEDQRAGAVRTNRHGSLAAEFATRYPEVQLEGTAMKPSGNEASRVTYRILSSAGKRVDELLLVAGSTVNTLMRMTALPLAWGVVTAFLI
jgi:hypothetical protein